MHHVAVTELALGKGLKTKNIFTSINKAEDLVRALVGDDATKIHTTQNKQTTTKKSKIQNM